MLKQEVFSKENIKVLNSRLLNKNNLEAISREEKKDSKYPDRKYEKGLQKY